MLTPAEAVRRLRATLADPIAPKVALGLAIGAVGGFVAHALHVPLAFMLGALFATIAASASGLPVAQAPRLRMAFLVVIGLFLGQSFEAEALGRMADWPLSVLLAVLYVPVASAAAFLFYRHVARIEPVTALFSAIPGGLSAVVLFSGALGADERQVALGQSLRIAIVVVTAPLVVFGALGYAEPAAADVAPDPIALADAGLLAAAALVGVWAFTRLGWPMPQMVAPLAVSAALRLSGVVDGDLPFWLVETALVVTGSSIGCRFAGVRGRDLARIAGWTLGGTAVLAAVSALFALASAALTGGDPLAAMLAFAPGGVAEMALIALALDIDPSFVATHHLARIAFILALTPFFAARLARLVRK